MKKVTKYALLIIFFQIVTVYCASSGLKNVDLQTKGILKANIIIQDSEMWSKSAPLKLYFKKLDNPTDFSKGKIIASKVRDNGYIAINYEPGTYIVVAGEIIVGMTRVLVCFDEDTMKFTKTELKAGETAVIKEVYVIRNSVSLWGKVSKLQTQHRKAIGRNLSSLSHSFCLGELNKNLHKKTNVNKEKLETVEEYK